MDDIRDCVQLGRSGSAQFICQGGRNYLVAIPTAFPDWTLVGIIRADEVDGAMHSVQQSTIIALGALCIFAVIIVVLALGMVFATSAVRNSLMNYIGYFAVIAAIMLAALVVYAFGWQQVIKHLPLTTAYANKAVTVVWGILLGLAVFGEAVTPRQVIGAVIIICGIVLFVRADNEGEGGK